MERSCQYPGCHTTLSDHVPLHIPFCGEHQYQLRELRKKLTPESLPEEDIQFIFFNQNGCSAADLAKYLGIPPSTMRSYLQRGTIKARRRRGFLNWQIPSEEIERVIILVRNWIPIWSATDSDHALKRSLYTCALNDYFGPCQISLNGRLAIRKEQLTRVKEKCRSIIRARTTKRRVYLNEDEMIPGEVARLLHVTRKTVYKWMGKGRLPCERRNWIGKSVRNTREWFVIKKGDLVEFARRVLAGEYQQKSRVKKALKEFLCPP